MTKDRKIYSAQWSVLTWLITGLVFALLLGFLGWYFLADSLWLLCPAVLLGAIIIGCFLFAPFHYTLTDNSILVNRPIGGLRIPFDIATGIRRIEKHELGTVTRTFGVGGLFGNFGCFSSSSIGSFRAYITNTKNMVLATDPQGQKTILSPSNPDDFIQTVLQAKSAG